MTDERNDNPEAEEPTLLPARTDDPGLRLLSRLDNADLYIRTDLPRKERWAQILISKASGEPTYRLEDVPPTVVLIVHYVARPVMVTLSDTGEIVPRLRVTLFTVDDKTITWTSDITTGRFADIIGMVGRGPWSSPIPIRFTKTKGKKTGYWYGIELADVPAEAKGKGK